MVTAYPEGATIEPGTRVRSSIYGIDLDDDPQCADVIDHTRADMTPPDDGMVLVRWSSTTLRWEYTEDLAPWA